MLTYSGTDRNSTNLNGLLQAAESVGLDAQAVKGEAGSLTPEVPVPCIAHVRKDQYHHFVVIYKISKTRVRVADPDPNVGKVTYSHDEFSAIWTGYLVLLSRGEHFSRTRDNPGLFARFLVDDVLFSESRLTLHVISTGVVIITLMQVDAAITLGFLHHLLRLPLAFFDSRKVGEVLSRLSDTIRIRVAVSSEVHRDSIPAGRK